MQDTPAAQDAASTPLDASLPAATPVAPLDATALPGTRYDLSPRIRTLWFWQSLLSGVIPAIPLTIVGLLSGRTEFLLAAPLVAVLVVLLRTAYNRAYLRNFLCVLLPDGVLLKRGVLWQTETFVPRPRIQHTDVTQGPIARHFGIATIKIFTAGSAIGQLSVEGLPYDDAVALRDRLLGRAGTGHDAV